MKHSIPQGIACILSVSLLLLALAGCSQQAPKEKTVIKMLYTNNFNHDVMYRGWITPKNITS